MGRRKRRCARLCHERNFFRGHQIDKKRHLIRSYIDGACKPHVFSLRCWLHKTWVTCDRKGESGRPTGTGSLPCLCAGFTAMGWLDKFWELEVFVKFVETVSHVRYWVHRMCSVMVAAENLTNLPFAFSRCHAQLIFARGLVKFQRRRADFKILIVVGRRKRRCTRLY